jgi:hypothetical protein
MVAAAVSPEETVPMVRVLAGPVGPVAPFYPLGPVAPFGMPNSKANTFAEDGPDAVT